MKGELILTLCCRCFGETLSTLQFAKRAKLIKNKVCSLLMIGVQ